MKIEILDLLQAELKTFKTYQIKAVLELLEDGNTVPFIARYRKEVTGSLDEVEIRTIQERSLYLENLESRKEEVCRLIDEQGKLTESLKTEVMNAKVLQKVEDLYRPYKQKRRTKATIAKERGLEPLAIELLTCPQVIDVEAFAESFIDPEHELTSGALCLEGAHEIMAEVIGDEPSHREWIRSRMFNEAVIKTRLKDETADDRHVYEMYYDFTMNVKGAASHRVLAINRAEKEGVIKVDLEMDDTKILTYFNHQLIGNNTDSPAAIYVEKAYEDAYKRFIKPSLDREIRNALTEEADQQAIHIFGENLRNLLLQAPVKGHVVMGFDPAYRTGCKLAIVDETGKVIKIHVIYPHKPADATKRKQASEQFCALIADYKVDIVAIGNGTASRESEVFVSENLKQCERDVTFIIVNEAGASVYSASDGARLEFPDLQVEERSAISIARRLQDPLAELVKIDPKSVGVGQYQHDVSQKNLTERLDFVVETAVNQVGVDVNTASPQLLEHVAGLTKTTAKNIVAYREEHGSFEARNAIKKVPRLGPKSYEQAIGFLRIPRGKNILDNTGIHPESYAVAKEILTLTGLKPVSLGTEEATSKLNGLRAQELADSLNVGRETLEDILASMKAPGRDMRESFAGPLLRSDVLTLEDLKPGMELDGTVRNVVDFGAFVDIGVKQDGLVHISKLSKNFVKHPTDIVAVGDIVKVWVMEADVHKQRVQLSMIPITVA